MAKVTRSQYDIDQRRMINDVLIYVLNRASSIWTVMKDTRHFERAWNALPPALQLFALLKAQALMADCISWHGTKTAMESAENYGLVSAEACDKYQEHMERTAEKHIREIYSEQELDQMDSIEEAAYEYLEEHVKISPVEILAVLSELGLIQVDDSVWSQLLEEEATDKLNEMPPE